MALAPGAAYGSVALEVGGKAAGLPRRVQPPGYEVTQVAASGAAPGSAQSAGRLTPTPVDADFAFVGPDPLLDWALTLPRRAPLAMDGAIQLLDRNQRVLRRIEWTQGLPTELRLPELDATSKSLFTVGLAWQPEAIRFVRTGAGTVMPGPVRNKTVLLSNFRVSGMPFDTSGVTRVALPTVRAKFATESTGMQLLPRRRVAGVDIGEVRLEVSARSADAVRDWVARVAGDGAVTDAERVDFAVELLDATLKNTVATITLRGCALTGYAEFELTAAAQTPANVALRFSVGDLDFKAVA